EATARIRLGLGLIEKAIGREEAWLEERLRSFGNSKAPRDLKTPGGRWHEIRERRLSDGCILLSSIDVTERREAEQALANQQALLRALIDNIPVSIFAKDREARFIIKNRFDADLMGAATVEETIGKSDFDYYAHDVASIFYEEDMEVIHEGVTLVGGEMEFAKGPNGDAAWLTSIKAPFRDSEGAIIGLVGCTHDITERRAMEQALIRHRDQLEDLVHERTAALQRQAERLERALNQERELAGLQRQFVSMVSHEFRTPLSIIDGHANSILRRSKGNLPDRSVEGISKIRRSVARLIELMESVLAAARLEDGRIKFNPGDCLLPEIIAELAGNYRELYPDHEILLDVDPASHRIIADGRLLRQVFSNLISNAVKYSPDGGRVWIEGHAVDNGGVVVAVRDEGVGIPASEQEKLFNRFFRASTSTGIAGTGIGLHLASHLVQLHGGKIDVESVVAEGTTFLVHLPTRPPVANDDQPFAEKPAKGPQSPEASGSENAA
ncbi:MAG: ATP-binding protein, partial [Pseudomonadota bacterium]